MKKKLLVICASLIALGGINPDSGIASLNSFNKGGRVVIYSQEEPQSLSPLFNVSDSAKSIYNMIYSGLVRVDDSFHHYADLAVFVPTAENRGVVETEEGMIVTYKLKDTAFWHDGVPVTSDDIIFTWQSYKNPNIQKVSQENLDGYQKIYKIEAPDAKTVKIYFSEKYEKYNDLFRYVLPKHGYIPKTLLAINDKHPFNFKPIGSGPFKFIEWKKGKRIVVDVNDRYYKARPYLDQIVYNYGKFDKNVINDLEKGSIHIYQPNNPDSRKLIENVKGVENFIITGLEMEELAFNMDKNELKDINVRKAIIHSINKDKVASMFPEVQNSYSDTHPTSSIYDTKMRDIFIYDMKKSQYLLDSSGWIIDEKDGLRKKNGQILELNLLTTDSGIHNAFSAHLKENMSYLGIKVNVNKTNDMLASSLANNYDLALYKKNIAIDGTDRAKYLSSNFIAPKGFNYSRFNDARLNSVFNNPNKIDNIDAQRFVSDVLREELPVIPLYNYTKDIAVSSRVNNFRPNMVEGNTWNSTEWWVN